MKNNKWRWVMWAILIFVAVSFFTQNRSKTPEGDERIVLEVGQVGFTIRDFKHLLSELSPDDAALSVGERKQRILDKLTMTAILLQFAGKQQWGSDSGLKLAVWQLAADYARRRILDDFGQGDKLSEEERERVVGSAVRELRDSMTITIHENLMALVGFDTISPELTPSSPTPSASADPIPSNGMNEADAIAPEPDVEVSVNPTATPDDAVPATEADIVEPDATVPAADGDIVEPGAAPLGTVEPD